MHAIFVFSSINYKLPYSIHAPKLPFCILGDTFKLGAHIIGLQMFRLITTVLIDLSIPCYPNFYKGIPFPKRHAYQVLAEC